MISMLSIVDKPSTMSKAEASDDSPRHHSSRPDSKVPNDDAKQAR